MAKYSTYGTDCERLYVRENVSIDDLHASTGISKTTLYAWKKEYKWDIKRKIYLSSPTATVDLLERILRRKVEQLSEMPIEEISNDVGDNLVKLMASVRRAKKEEHPRTQVINVFSKFAPFVKNREKDKDRIEWLTDMMQTFFEEIRDEG